MGPDAREPASSGDRLRQARLAARLTQEELAARCGLSVRTISDLERGRVRAPSPRSVRMLEAALELPAQAGDSLLGLGQVPQQASSVTGSEPPRQLPAGPRQFAGRAAELAMLTRLIGAAEERGDPLPVIAIVGGAGVGKTALALRWAHQNKGAFAGGQLYADLRNDGNAPSPAASLRFLRRFIGALRPAWDAAGNADLDTLASTYRTLVAERRLLVVLDNARDAAQVRPLLPGNPDCLVLVTSRFQLTGLAAADGAQLLTLEVMTTSESRAFLTARLGTERIAAEPRAVAELITLCGGLPLALSIAAARVLARPKFALAELVADLRASGQLDALDTGEAATAIRSVFSSSHDRLSEPAAAMFGLLGLHPGPGVSVRAAASLSGLPLPAANSVLAELTSAHLVTELAPGRFGSHQLLRVYAAEHASSYTADERRLATRRMLDYYLRSAIAADRLLDQDRSAVPLPPVSPAASPAASPAEPEALGTAEEAFAWFDREYLVIAELAAVAASQGHDQAAWLLPATLRSFRSGKGKWPQWLVALRSALTAAERLGDPYAQAVSHHGLGKALIYLGPLGHARSHLVKALDWYRQAGDKVGESNACFSMARLYEENGDLDSARRCTERSLRLCQHLDSTAEHAHALSAMGWYQLRTGVYPEAMDNCERALALHRDRADRIGIAITLDSLALGHRAAGDHRRAAAEYLEAIDGLRTAADGPFRAEALTSLGDTFRAAGDNASARRSWQQAMTILEELGQPSSESVRDRLAAL